MQLTPGRRTWLCSAGLGFLLLYALPLFVPPAARLSATAAADASLIARLFPEVPAWWVAGRLLALLVGASVIAAVSRQPAVHSVNPLPTHTGTAWRYPWLPRAALLAAFSHVLFLPWRSSLPPIGQTVFMLWFVLPAALLAWGARRPATRSRLAESMRTSWPVAAVIVTWIVFRVAVSWHTPRAADVVDTWRVFGGFVQLSESNGNFLTASLDPELPGLSAMQVFFQGLPLLHLLSLSPGLTWVQVTNALWLALGAASVAALAALVIGRSAAVIATVAYLFSPFILLIQLCPMPPIALVLPAVAGLLLVAFYRSSSPAALALLGSVTGIAAGMPPLVLLMGLAVLLVVWRLWTGPRVSSAVMLTALLSLLVGIASSLPSPATMLEMYGRYVATQIPMAVAEQAVHGQISPTIEDWYGGPLPAGVPLAELRIPVTRGWLLVPLGALLAPFAIARWSLRLWADTLFDPLSAGLVAVGIAVCLRHAVRDRMSLAMLLFLAAALVAGFASSYDRTSLFRLLGSPVPVALLAAAGFKSISACIPSAAGRRRATIAASIAIAIGGTVIFDVVNPRLLAASSLGLLVRSVDDESLDRVALLTAAGRDTRSDVPPGRRHWDLDWLRHHHPYVEEIVRVVPKRPIPIADIESLTPPGQRADRDIVFWSPALEQTVGVSQRLCDLWPDADVYTISDTAGLSRVYGARLAGPSWTPALSSRRWKVASCGVRE
jgi:hypothetical protein